VDKGVGTHLEIRQELLRRVRGQGCRCYFGWRAIPPRGAERSEAPPEIGCQAVLFLSGWCVTYRIRLSQVTPDGYFPEYQASLSLTRPTLRNAPQGCRKVVLKSRYLLPLLQQLDREWARIEELLSAFLAQERAALDRKWERKRAEEALKEYADPPLVTVGFPTNGAAILQQNVGIPNWVLAETRDIRGTPKEFGPGELRKLLAEYGCAK
jgi:hypothetical protein